MYTTSSIRTPRRTPQNMIPTASSKPRTPLADMTHHDCQSQNIQSMIMMMNDFSSSSLSSSQVTENSSSNNNNTYTVNKSIIGKTIRTYVHNPYEPVVLHDETSTTEELTLSKIAESPRNKNNNTNTSRTTTTTTTTHTTKSQGGLKDSRVFYVNGRPVVLTSATPTSSPSQPKSPIMAASTTPLCAQTPNVSIHDLSFVSDVDASASTDEDEEVDLSFTTPQKRHTNADSHREPELSPITECAHNTEDTIVRVSFRKRIGNYLCRKIALKVNDYCVVEGDRGYDIGRVVDVLSSKNHTSADFESNAGYTAETTLKNRNATKENSSSSKREAVKMQHVLRVATDEEIHQIHTSQRLAENEALSCIRAEAQRLELKMDIKSCEYQFDRQKIFFYFESCEKVMFVPLLKYMHREYHCRIWLQQINRE